VADGERIFKAVLAPIIAAILQRHVSIFISLFYIALSREVKFSMQPTLGLVSSLQTYKREKSKMTSLYLLLLTNGLRKRVVCDVTFN
jgi:hypothetical protein